MVRPEGRRPLVRHDLKLEENIKMLFQKRIGLWPEFMWLRRVALMNVLLNLRFPKNVGALWTKRRTF